MNLLEGGDKLIKRKKKRRQTKPGSTSYKKKKQIKLELTNKKRG
jgi:hypothetical protein